MSTDTIKQPLITEVLGITDPTNLAASFSEAAETLGYPLMHPAITLQAPQESEDAAELRTDTRIVTEVLTKNPDTASTLIDWLTYREMMRNYGTRGNGSASALMIGSMGAISSRAFVCLAKDEYGAGEAHIIDPIETEAKRKHGIFQPGSGLDMPYEADSMDFVHTNQLLHMLEDPSSPNASPKKNIRRLVEEVKRVLAPGGQLCMKELVLGDITADLDPAEGLARCSRLSNFLFKALTSSHNMDQVVVELGWIPRDIDFLFDPKRQFDGYPRDHSAVTINVFAQKRKRLPALLG